MRICSPGTSSVHSSEKLWVIAEWDRSATTLLLPE
jgi:hypothetical protein